MTGRERIRCVFFGTGQPDRVPWMEQAFASDVASSLLGRPADTGSMLLFQSECEAWLKGDDAHQEWVEKTRRDLVDLAIELGIDMIGAPWCMGQRPTKKLQPGVYLFQGGDGSESVWQIDLQTGAAGWKRIKGRQETMPDIEASAAWIERSLAENPPKASDYDLLMAYRALAGERIEIMGEAYLAIPMNELYLSAVVEAPALIERYLDASTERNILSYGVQAQLGFRILNGGGVFGLNAGVVYGPEQFRRLVLPRYQRKVEAAHRWGLKYIFRSDGDIWSIADDLFRNSTVSMPLARSTWMPAWPWTICTRDIQISCCGAGSPAASSCDVAKDPRSTPRPVASSPASVATTSS